IKDALLELESTNKGLLHTRVQLKSLNDAAPLSQHVAGMMVYNTATANDVVPGIYFNDGTRWVFVGETLTTLALAGDDVNITYTDEDGVPHDIDMTGIVKNLETLTILDYDPSTQKLIYKGEDGIANEFDLIELVSGSETITELLDNGDGTFVYLNEEGTLVTFDANTLTITEAGGVYTFTDAKGLLEEIDTNAEAIAFDNTVTNLL